MSEPNHGDGSVIDPFKLATADKSHALTIRSTASGFTCAICGAEQEAHAWRVSLPDRLGTACPGCAGDAGWETR